MLLAVAATAFTFTACNDDDNDGPKPFESELIGSYKSAPVTMTIPGVIEEPADFNFILLPTWSDPENIPGIDLSASMELPAGTFVMPMNTICGLLQAMVSNIVKGGLVQIDLKNDGSFGAQYYDLIIKTDGETGEPDIISSLMAPTFGTVVKTFPNADTAELLPEGALGYYTKDSRFYFTLSKDFLKGVGTSAGLDVLSVIDEMIKTYKLDIVSTDAYYGVPLKYSVKDGVTKLYVDRGMILSFRGVLEMVFSLLGDDAAFMGIKLEDIVNKVLDNTTELEIALPLKRI